MEKKFWSNQKKLWLLFSAAAIVILIRLPNTELWTEENHWAAVCIQMLLRHDWFHPYRYCGTYYDKPLLSYWLILVVARILGTLNELALRLPSALAGLTTLFCTYSLGKKLFNSSVGLTAGWLLITCYSFIFWSRVAGADMSNLAGIMLAIYWYEKNKAAPNFFSYLVFFVIIACTCLCKGLLGLVIPILVVFSDLVLSREWKKHRFCSLLIAFIIATAIYLAPFLLSALLPNTNTTESGLYLVFRENILRFFAPFDHKDPLYTYFIYLPLYTLPWFLLFIPALWHNLSKWHKLDYNSRWLISAMLIVFLFLTLSGSRRTYYILPLVPFTMLIIANWLQSYFCLQPGRQKQLAIMVLVIYLLLLAWFGFLRYFINLHDNNMQAFATKVRNVATKTRPWSSWRIEVFNTADQKAVFYLKPEKSVTCFNIKHVVKKSTLIITQKKDLAALQSIPNKYQVIFSGTEPNSAVALLPKKQHFSSHHTHRPPH